MAINEKYLQEKCKGVMTITCRHIVVTLCVIYFVMACLVYGTTAARVERANESRCAAENPHSCYRDVAAESVGPFIAGMIWPIYLPLHLSYTFFR